jgi:pyruvate dehydrogenase E2 component (dihydrolipoamide acetyltransferase)
MTVEQGKAVYRMPSLGSDMEAGTLIEWVKQPGDRLAKGDVIAVVETQKGAIEVEVFQDAVMGRILVEPGESVPVGTPMAELEGAEVEPRAAEPAQPLPRHPGREVGIQGKECKPAAGTEAKASDEQAEPRRRKPEAGAPSTRRRVSPAARRLAEEHHIDLATMTGSGPDGAITLDDVRAAAKPEQPAPSEGQPRPRGKLDLAAMREAIAAAMSRSKRTIPHYYLGHDIDLTPAAGWLAARNAELPPDGRLLMGVLLIKAVAVTLHAFPELNGFDRDGRFEPSEAIHIGTATAIRGGAEAAQLGVVQLGDCDAKALVQRGDPVQEVHRVEVELVAQIGVVRDCLVGQVGGDLGQLFQHDGLELIERHVVAVHSVSGSWRRSASLARNRAPRWPSLWRWSAERVAVTRARGTISSSTTQGRSCGVPKPTMATCGG